MLFAELSMLFSQVSCVIFLQTAKSLSPGNTEVTESEQPNSGVLGLHISLGSVSILGAVGIDVF